MEPLWLWLVFTGVMGCCVGSFLNVVVYRMPEGHSLVHPGSHCPRCDTPLAWYDNLPVLGWLLLRARCRYCRSPISVQYPLVEAHTGLIFAALYYAFYMAPMRQDIPHGEAGLFLTWPVLAVHLALLAALIAATLIDARYFIIPLAIPNTVAIAALTVYPALAALQPASVKYLPHTGVAGTGAALGAVVGVALANLLLWLGVLPRSMDEQSAEAAQAEQASTPDQPPATEAPPSVPADQHPGGAASQPSAASGTEADKPVPRETVPIEPHDADVVTPPSRLPVLLVGGAAAAMLGATLYHLASPLAGALAAYVIAAYTLIYEPIKGVDEGEEVLPWLPFPNIRAEALKELLFMLLPAAGLAAGWFLASRLGQERAITWSTGRSFSVAAQHASKFPAFVHVFGGAFLGYLTGAGLVWATRVLGTLAYNKEAMGLGDVHLLGGIGAVIGPLDVTCVFFMAPFLGLLYAAATFGVARMARIRFQPIPYGPHICMATLILLFARDPIAAFAYERFGLGSMP
jgi:prepilin signal peptidase PulO-like enzyme (type II secretory pathway)